MVQPSSLEVQCVQYSVNGSELSPVMAFLRDSVEEASTNCILRSSIGCEVKERSKYIRI